MCVKMIMNAGIGEVHYASGYPDPLAMDLAAEGGLEMMQFATIGN
jgi:deoxycytidylate deaminase